MNLYYPVTKSKYYPYLIRTVHDYKLHNDALQEVTDLIRGVPQQDRDKVLYKYFCTKYSLLDKALTLGYVSHEQLAYNAMQMYLAVVFNRPKKGPLLLLETLCCDLATLVKLIEAEESQQGVQATK